MPDIFLSPERVDWFCRNVLADLAVFRYAVETGSRKGAHEKVNKSAQAVGQALQRIQEHLGDWLNGGVLTDPSHKKVIEPTEAGMLLSGFAEKVIAECETLVASLHALQSGKNIRLACIHSGWMAYGRRLEEEFATRIPGGSIDVEIITGRGYPAAVAEAVRSGRADAGITPFPPKVSLPLVLQPLQNRELKLIFNARYRYLPKPGNPVRLSRVISKDDKLKVAVHGRANDSPLGNRVVHYLKQCRAEQGQGQLFECQNIAEIRASIERFPGVISILPTDAVEDGVANGTLKAYSLDPELPPWEWALIYRSGTYRKPVLEFIECLRPLFKKRPHKNLAKS